MNLYKDTKGSFISLFAQPNPNPNKKTVMLHIKLFKDFTLKVVLWLGMLDFLMTSKGKR